MNNTLSQFLSAAERPEGTMNYAELHGFLFAIACSPEAIDPNEWLPLIFNDTNPAFKDEQESEQHIKAIVDIYNEIHEELQEGKALLPACCQLLSPAIDNLAEGSSIAAWSKGFLDGHEWLSELWENCVPPQWDEELGSCLMMLLFFANRELAEAFCAETEASLDELADVVTENFEAAMNSYAHIGHQIRMALMSGQQP